MAKHKYDNPYKSGLEYATATWLESRKRKFKYEPFRLKYTLVLKKSYKPDFELDNGIIVETKGRFTSDDRRKHLQVRLEHPDKDIRFVFMRDNTLSKNSTTTYTDWCKENGFLCAVGKIPEEWLKEKKK